MKKLMTTLALFGLTMAASAIPAKRFNQIVRQSDGSELTIQLRGDETFHYYVTLDGTPVRKAENGDWVADTRDIQGLQRAAQLRRNYGREQLAPRMKKAMRAVKAPYRAGEVTTKKGLLILVNFQDKKMHYGDQTNAIFDQMMNGIENPYGRNNGSVREYFRAQSYNQFDIEFDVVGPVTVSQKMAYYGANDADGYDVRAEEMIVEACKLVDDQVNFADYDWDGDGEVENIYVTYAGYGESSDPDTRLANTIWPHQWRLTEAGKSLKLDGVKIDTYACGSELANYSGYTIDGIGTMCHEYSHCLGLPDFYDTSSNGTNFGMNAWSLMDYGCYNDDGFCPAGYTAYERWFSGWLEPKELASPCEVKDLQNIERNPEAYIIYNDKNHNEYYLLANHQKLDWDKSASGHGMMVLHVDYSQTIWYNNTVNNSSNRQRMTIIPADNTLRESSLSTDLWPSTRKNTALTDESKPAATLYNANTDGQKLMHKPITNITESGAQISFTFMGGIPEEVLSAPELAEATGITATGFQANWQAVEGAVSYNLSYVVEEQQGEEPVDETLEAMNLYEDFDAFNRDETATTDGTVDIGEKLDDYTFVPGWTGSKVYEGLYGAKLASSKEAGYLVTPELEGESGSLTIYLQAWNWFNYVNAVKGNYNPDVTSIVVSLLDENGQELQKQTVAANDILDAMYGEEFDELFVRFSNVPSAYKVKIATSGAKQRAYVTYLLAFDGNFSDDEILSLFQSEDDEELEEAPARGRKSLKLPARRVARRAAAEPKVVEGITDTNYQLTDLPEGATVTFKVQAVDADGKTSAWSKEQVVTLVGGDAVEAVEATLPVAREAYDLAGRRLSGAARRGIVIMGGRKVVIK